MEQQQKIKLSCVKEKKMLIAYELAHTDMIVTSTSVKELWLNWYPEDKEYFEKLPYKWNNCYNWISRYISKHDDKFICEAIQKQRIRQKHTINKKLKHANKDAHVIIIKSQIKKNRLAKYLLIDGSYRRTGDFGSIIQYINQNFKNKSNEEDEKFNKDELFIEETV